MGFENLGRDFVIKKQSIDIIYFVSCNNYDILMENPDYICAQRT